jgi:hypothetical protein
MDPDTTWPLTTEKGEDQDRGPGHLALEVEALVWQP